MKHRIRFLLALAATVCIVVLMACGGEDTIVDPPEPSFQVTVEVTDPSGVPVAGLTMSLAPGGPWYGEKSGGVEVAAMPIERLFNPFPCPFSPVVTLVCELDEDRDVQLTVEDISGGLVRPLIDEPLVAGVHHVAWNGLDDAGARVPSGVYRAHLVLRDQITAEVVLDQSQSMLMAILDPERYSVGTTDADGRIVLDDLRLFPHLIDDSAFPAMDENGEQIGMISLSESMRFELRDPDTGDRLRFHEDVAGNTTLHITWDPAP